MKTSLQLGFDKLGCCGINGTMNGGSNTRVLAKVMVALGFIWVLTETWMGLGTRIKFGDGRFCCVL